MRKIRDVFAKDALILILYNFYIFHFYYLAKFTRLTFIL